MVKRAVEYVTAANLEQKTAAWLANLRGAVRPRPQLEIELSRCALLVVDMLRYFAAEAGRAFLPATRAITPQIEALVALFRESKRPIVYTRHCHTGLDDLGMLGRFYRDYIHERERDSLLIDAFRPEAPELLLRKNTYDAFYRTKLAQWLRDMDVDQILVTGVLTHLCCETTVRSGFVRGFEMYVAADGMATSTERLHTSSLLTLADGFAIVLSTAEVMTLCKKSR